jgi:hypothetical protein
MGRFGHFSSLAIVIFIGVSHCMIDTYELSDEFFLLGAPNFVESCNGGRSLVMKVWGLAGTLWGASNGFNLLILCFYSYLDVLARGNVLGMGILVC